MPPQPLSKVRRTARVNFETFSHLEDSSLATLVAEIVQIGAGIDHIWSRFLVDLLRADPRTGMAMYQAISSAEARLAALKAAASNSLEKDDYALFECVLDAMKPQRTVRNKFAHHLWGISPDIPHALLLLDPKDAIASQVSLAEANNMMLETGFIQVPDIINRSRIMVWNEEALLEATETAKETHKLARHVWAQIHFWGDLKVDRMQSALLFLRLGEQVLQRWSKQTGRPIPPAPRGRIDPS